MSDKLYISNKLHKKTLLLVRPCFLYSDYQQNPFRFMINLDKFSGGEKSYESERFWFMYTTQCVLFVGFKLTIPNSLEKGPTLK